MAKEESSKIEGNTGMDKGHFIMREKNICLWLGNEEIPFLECERILWYEQLKKYGEDVCEDFKAKKY